ncbi:MAG TPA: LysR family transcriptional regulator [Spongiibacteraceae bacterium]|nr:LysR family transcriptional regulator [Spongiibacteraceae bacterium]
MSVKFNNVDLNLFRVFDTIYTEANLTRAGQILCITQPAVSNALTRLRQVFDDQLFIRTAKGMTPTPVAQNAIGSIRQALELLRAGLSEGDTFERETSCKLFRLSLADLAEVLILPKLLMRVHQSAPHVSVESHYLNYDESVKELATGKMDFTVASPLLDKTQLNYALIIEDNYVCAVRQGHPVLNKKFDLDEYLKLSHIHLSRQKERNAHVDQVDHVLHKLGRERSIALWAEHYAMAPHIVESSDLALTIPRAFAEQCKLSILELPFEMPKLELYLYWHKSTELDPANRWFRETLLEHTPPAADAVAELPLKKAK